LKRNTFHESFLITVATLPSTNFAAELKDGTIVTGSNSSHLHAASSLILHAIKHLAEIPAKIKLLPTNITESVSNLKTEILNEIFTLRVRGKNHEKISLDVFLQVGQQKGENAVLRTVHRNRTPFSNKLGDIPRWPVFTESRGKFVYE